MLIEEGEGEQGRIEEFPCCEEKGEWAVSSGQLRAEDKAIVLLRCPLPTAHCPLREQAMTIDSFIYAVLIGRSSSSAGGGAGACLAVRDGQFENFERSADRSSIPMNPSAR
jgi:hypothetical protein